MSQPDNVASDAQRRRIRRSAWLLFLVAAGFYVAFILMSVLSVRS